METTVTKLDAAWHLLDAALVALLDRNDSMSAIVLGGAAEDIFVGLLKLEGREGEGARQEMIPHIRAFLARDTPDAPVLRDGEGHDTLRRTFNWLRHSDRADDPAEWTLDFELEAAAVVERAVVNASRLTGTDHPRWQDLLLLGRRWA